MVAKNLGILFTGLFIVFQPGWAKYPLITETTDIGDTFKTNDGNLYYIEKTTKDSKKIYLQLPAKIQTITTSAKFDSIGFGSNGATVLVDNSAQDKLVKWSYPSTTTVSSISYAKKADMLATKCSIGGDGTIACMLSGTFDNAVKIITADLAKTAKVKDPKTNQNRDITEDDFREKVAGLLKFDCNAADLVVTDEGTAIWWQNNVFGKKLYILPKGQDKPYRYPSTVEHLFFTKDGRIVWYEKGMGGGKVNILRPEFIAEPVSQADTSTDDEGTDEPSYRELDPTKILTFSGNFKNLHYSPNGNMVWWDDDFLKILYADYYEKAEEAAKAEVDNFDGLSESEKTAEIFKRVQPVRLDADPKSVAINVEGTIAWADGDRIKVMRRDEEINTIDEKADFVTITNAGTIAWTGHRPLKYWVKVLLPGEREARYFEHWADGLTTLGDDLVIWWGTSDIEDWDETAVIPYVSMFGLTCFLPQPIAGENGCDSSGSLGQKIQLIGSYDPPNAGDLNTCYKKADLKVKWNMISAPRNPKTKPTVSASTSNAANFTPDPEVEEHYQGRYDFKFCVNVDKTTYICDEMSVEVVGQFTTPPEVPCESTRSDRLFNCGVVQTTAKTDLDRANHFYLFFALISSVYLCRRYRLAKFFLPIVLVTFVMVSCETATLPEEEDFDVAAQDIQMQGGSYEVTLGLPLSIVDRTFYFNYPAEVHLRREENGIVVDLELFVRSADGKPTIYRWQGIPLKNNRFRFVIEKLPINRDISSLLDGDTSVDIEVNATIGSGIMVGQASILLDRVPTAMGRIDGVLDATFAAEKSISVQPRIKLIRELQ